MDQLEQYRHHIQTVFETYQAEGAIAISDDKTGNYLLMNVGWRGYQREYGVFFHLRIVNGEMHIEWNGTEDIIDELIEQGIPESLFVCAFRHPELRLQPSQQVATVTP